MLQSGEVADLDRPVSEARSVSAVRPSLPMDEDEALSRFSDADLERFARHLVLPEIGARGQLALSRARVALVGMGGIGCPAAQALAQCGVGALGLIDPDTVSLSNLPRQLLFRSSDVGRPKALVAAEVLEEFSPDLSVKIVVEPVRTASVERLLSGYDVVIDGSDNFETRVLVANWCQAQPSMRLVAASVTGTEGQLLCLDAHSSRYSTLFPEGPPPEQNCADVGVLATSSMLIGQLASQAVVQWLVTGQRPEAQLISTWPLRIMRLQV